MATLLERYGSWSDVIQAVIDGSLAKTFTTLPVSIKTDGDGHTATAVSTIKGLVRKPDGSVDRVGMTEFSTMPIHYAGGGSVVSTHPVKSGDEGIALFSARPLDSWHQAGGVQNPIDALVHRLSDAFFLGGVRSDPNKLANVAPDAIHHRSKDGKITHEVHPTDGTKTKVVDPSDTAGNPFADATTYHETKHSPSSGIVKTAKDPHRTHTVTLERMAGFAVSVVDASIPASHSISISPAGGISMATSLPSLNLPAGGVGGSALASGAAASNVGTLGGDLSGTLPSPSVVSILHVAGANALTNAASDSAAALAGVAVGGLYRNGSSLCVRVA